MNIKKIPFIALLLINSCVFAQITPQIMVPSKITSGTRGEGERKFKLYGFLPFQGDYTLIAAFAGVDAKYNNAFQELQTSSLAMPTAELKATAMYVEMLSYIPKSSVGRFSGGVQLTQADLSDTLQRSQQALALQKVMNGGGNFNINFSRPLYYKPSSSGKGHFLMNFSSMLFLDGFDVNKDLTTTGIGLIPNIDFDWRLFSNKKSFSGSEARQIGNLFRAGIKGRAFSNLFNTKFEQANAVDKAMKNYAAVALGGYMGLGPLIFEFNYNKDNKNLTINPGWTFSFKFQPVKW